MQIAKVSRFVVAVLVAVVTAFAVTVKADPPYRVVSDHLQSPRGLAFGPGGRLYVAQAGSGGMTGKITEISAPSSSSPRVRDVLAGLPSEGGDGEFVGVDGISALGNGNIAAIMAESEAGGGPPLFGHLLEVNVAGQWRDVANVGNYNYAWSGDHQDLAYGDFPDSNPYGVLAVPGGAFVADAGTNTLNFVKANGDVSILAYFPDNPIRDSTPTCIAQGPDRALYVGTLALVDSILRGPQAIVYRVDPSQADPNDLDTVLTLATPWATGLWPINGCAFGPDGSFYASQLFTQFNPNGFPFVAGDVVKIPFETPDVHTSLTGGALTVPGGVAVGLDGAVYVSNGSAYVPEGQVVRLTNR